MSTEETVEEVVVATPAQEPEIDDEAKAMLADLKAKYGSDGFPEDAEKVEIEPTIDTEFDKKEIEAKEDKSQESEKAEQKQEDKKESEIVELKDYVETLENTKVLHKIDGEMVEVDLKEAVKDVLNKVSGVKYIEKQLTAIDKEKKSFYNEKQQIESYISEFGSRVKDGHILGGLEYFGQFAGLPPHVIKEQLIAALTPEIERRYSLDQKDLENEYLKAEIEYKAQLESEAKERSQKQAASAELQDKVNRLRETHGIDEDSWDLAFKELDSTLPPGAPITPEMVAEKASIKTVEVKYTGVAQNLVKKYELTESDKDIIVSTMKQYPNLSEQDVEELIKETLEIQSKQETEKKLAQKLGVKQSSQAPQSEEGSLDEAELIRLKRLAGVIEPWE